MKIKKYPRTRYLPFAYIPNEHKKDKVGDIKHLINKSCVSTIKMDGSNVKLTTVKVTARNGFDAPHVSFDYLKKIHNNIKTKIPYHIEIYAEWLYAKHSIYYENLEDYLQIFAVYNNITKRWLSWADVKMLANKLGLITVRECGRFIMDTEKSFKENIIDTAERVIKQGHEGIVVRNMYSFTDDEFKHNVMKYVRPNHVQTDQHWSTGHLIRNKLSKEIIKSLI